MNVCLFGGTFDPLHRGHIAIARAAATRYKLNRVLVAPSDLPPHKRGKAISSFHHRFAMVSLALYDTGDARVVPSSIELDLNEAAVHPHAARFTINTIRLLQHSRKKISRLSFLIGIDAFLDIGKWHRAEEVLRSCEFIVASRPGFAMESMLEAIPSALRPPMRMVQPGQKEIAHRGMIIHL